MLGRSGTGALRSQGAGHTRAGSCRGAAGHNQPGQSAARTGRATERYFPPSMLRTGLPNGSGLPPTDTMAVPR